MSDSTAPKNAGETTAPTADATQETVAATDEWVAPASQEELDRIIGERVRRERKKYADYEDLKEKAGRVEGLEAKVAELETQREHSTWVTEVAAEYDVPEGVLRGSTKEELEEHAKQLVPLMDGTTTVPSVTKTPTNRNLTSEQAAADHILSPKY